MEDMLKTMCERLEPEALAKAKEALHACHRGEISREASLTQLAALLGMPLAELEAEINRGQILNEPLLNYAKELKRTYKTAVLSNVSSAGLSRFIPDEQLAEAFDAVVLSGQIGYAKPEARAYEIVADRLGMRLDECIFTDDNSGFCDAARAVGMQAIVYQSFAQLKQDLEGMLEA